MSAIKTAEFAAEFQTFCAQRENGLLAVEVSLSSIGRWILESGADMDELCAILSEEQTDLVNSALAAV
jgi:hypothetical protein